MPELNHNFIKGRMNKDLDERLVSNGEYRDALNVEVSTSEGSNVGAVQVTMGNTQVGTGFGTCVASIADEKNDDIYWLVAGDNTDSSYGKDAILKYHKDNTTNTYITTPVLVDVWKVSTTILVDSNGANNTEYSIISNLGNQVDNITNVKAGMLVTGTFTNDTGGTVSVMGTSVANGATYVLNSSHGVVVDRIISDLPTNAGFRIYLKTTSGSTIYTEFPTKAGDTINFQSSEEDRVLQFDSTRLITGLNILDNLMFWTDNHSEPKKINITKCIEGTLNINTHSAFIVKDVDGNFIYRPYGSTAFGSKVFIKKEHITVVKKSPLIAPKLLMDDTEAQRGVIFASALTSFSDGTANLLANTTALASTIDITFLTQPSWNVGDTILAANDIVGVTTFEEGEASITLLLDAINLVTSVYTFTIVSITAEELPFINETWSFVLQRTEPLFEFKFPRFGYRYKYQDGEYSSFSPFSTVAFLPGPFDYDPKKGHNLGMKNQLRNLKIVDFVEEDSIRPKGVVAIDILYKESNSPNVYTFKTITTSDSEWDADGTNPNASARLTRGNVEVTTELIHATVPSNQLLRPWDNVPRKALAQEVTANRIVYGNYLQNYNIKNDTNHLIKLKNVLSLESLVDGANKNNPQPSIKSLRTYQLGIVYRDEHGRETPVLTSRTGTTASLNVRKKSSANKNKLVAKMEHEPPSFADTFKFFIKETSNEYYNMSMDRWYNAGDGNVWISFPSSERNKVDIDTYLILKKQHDTDVFVNEDARYKILDISSEVPEYIKITKKVYGTLANNSSNTLFGDSGGGGIPERGVDFIYVNKESLDESSVSQFADDSTSGGKTQYVRVKTTTQNSHWYEVASVNAIELLNAGTEDTYQIQLTETIGPEMDFTTGGTGLFADIISGLKIQFARDENEVKEEHRGRFFVKIYRDSVLQTNIMKSTTQSQTWISVFSEPIYYINSSSYLLNGSWDKQVPGGGTSGFNFWGGLWSAISLDYEGQTKSWWKNFGSHWFIDNIRSRNNVSALGNGPTGIADSTAGDEAYNNGQTYGSRSSIASTNAGKTTGGITSSAAGGDAKVIHLAFSGVYSPGTSADANSSIDNHSNTTMPVLDIGTNANLDEKTWVDYMLQVGTVFKWSKDPDGTYYVVEEVELYKSGCTRNDNKNIEDELTNYDYISGAEYKHAANKRVRHEVTVGQWFPGGALPNDSNYVPGIGIGIGTNSAYNPIDGCTGVAGANHYDEPHSIEILELEEELEGDFSSTNPGIWETEPKEDVGLDLYYEVSDANPINLDFKTNEIYVPVTSYLTLPTNSGQVWSTSNNTYVPGVSLKVLAFNDNVVTINGSPLNTVTNPGPPITTSTVTLQAGNKIIFTKPSGGRVTGTVVSVANISGSNNSTITLNKNLHDEIYYLDWFNCYSFGNGVESNRIRDDFNAVTIDKGPKVSTTLATPYEEERKTNGLIYSGIYNSTSGINNLNQFIMAEKVTKDLNPRFGSIQKLHARDSDVVAFCEDKVVRLLANKDALFNADGNPQLIATNKVLGQTVPFAGDHGISKNPESFAVQAYNVYFSDKSRGTVMRLAQNGLTSVSEHGMKDYFNDNLKHAQTIIGSYDDKKSLYNITLKNKATPAISIAANVTKISLADTNTLSYYVFDNSASHFGINAPHTYNEVGLASNAYTNDNGSSSFAYGQYDASDNAISGGGSMSLTTQIHLPTTDAYGVNRNSSFVRLLDAFNDCPDGDVYLHYQVQAGGNWVGDVPSTYVDTGAPIATYKITSINTTSTGAYNFRVQHESGLHAQIDYSYFWWSSEGCEIKDGDSSKQGDFVETTISFAEKTNGWVSFKSWIQESGLSINGSFYTFKNGDLHEHETNLTRNNYYGVQYTSTIDVLLNEAPNAVKSFQTLKYSGSQARITQNNLTGTNSDGFNQFDNTYNNNIGKKGWYASSIETDLQSGKDLEFKSKEGKWFTTMQGISTYFNSASDTNVDEKEFSVQGIGYSSSISMTNDDGGGVGTSATEFTLTIKDDPSDH